MINVTKTFLPPQEEYQTILNRVWQTGWMTNRGELVKELETKLKTYLGVNHLLAMTNGTLPIQIAIKALGLTGDIITTPFSYVATTSSIVWEGCTPIFVDIHPEYLTIDENQIEAAITSKTSAILATHVFGNVCNVDAIDQIAKKHGLKVIYDAAHCFGVTYKGQSIFNYGDVSTCSFHATKLFHTGEGGCAISPHEHIQKRLFFYHNFGHESPGEFFDVGINAKMSELQAAMGLSVLPYVNDLIKKRKEKFDIYSSFLKKLDVTMMKLRDDVVWNYGYLPVIFKNETTLLEIEQTLRDNGINTRRYFFPSLNELSYLKTKKSMAISESISRRILCLPLYPDLENESIMFILEKIKAYFEDA